MQHHDPGQLRGAGTGPPGPQLRRAGPNRCWVADFTHITTWSATVYVAFVIAIFSRRIVDWSAATSKETQLVLDAPDMALW
ncbi:DDE-type integrase/transposase/recombinase [Streptomyces microflavus]|uniref:DDE-type integrase/transposase/recombinase n=1 Tax=Streptomyces microflavus TaxID=1919 RepID=UPI0034118C33